MPSGGGVHGLFLQPKISEFNMSHYVLYQINLSGTLTSVAAFTRVRLMFMRFCPNLLVNTAIVNEYIINPGTFFHKSDEIGLCIRFSSVVHIRM